MITYYLYNRVITIRIPHSMIDYADVSGNAVENTNLLAWYPMKPFSLWEPS